MVTGPTTTADDRSSIDAAVARVFRDEAGRITAGLVRILGDFDLAEEIVQETLVTALERWPLEGIPDRPGAWLTTAARRRAIDRVRRDANFRGKLALLEEPRSAVSEPDDRLRLVFTCCHPALSREAQVALTLRTVCGLTTPQVARAFLVPEATIAQRIVRAKRKIVEAGIPYRLPSAAESEARVAEVLAVLYLMFNEGYLSSGDEVPERRDLAEDAAWLAQLMARLLRDDPECWGLLALMRLHLARALTRFDASGNLVLLQDQDRSHWDRRAIAEATAMLEQAAAIGRPGPYQLQAAIAACHAASPSWDATDWEQLLALYDQLVEMSGSPVATLNRAIVVRHLSGPEAALEEVDALASDLDSYHLFHATRAELLDDLGRMAEGTAARRRALELTDNPAERQLLEARLAKMR
ncbi:MAG: RNA polymerase sigma factor [Candidatus Dormibacteria bacterium]